METRRRDGRAPSPDKRRIVKRLTIRRFIVLDDEEDDGSYTDSDGSSMEVVYAHANGGKRDFNHTSNDDDKLKREGDDSYTGSDSSSIEKVNAHIKKIKTKNKATRNMTMTAM